jgi:hypothetical protein
MVSFRMRLTGHRVDHTHVEVVDEDDHAGGPVFGAEADVVHAAVDAQGDRAALVDDVVADTVMGVVVAIAGDRLGSRLIGEGGRARPGAKPRRSRTGRCSDRSTDTGAYATRACRARPWR